MSVSEIVPANPALHVVLMTAPDEASAERLARTLVEEALAACVNLVPQIRSIYRWQGKIETGNEVLLIAKTRADCVSALIARVLEIHPYDVPEVIAWPITHGSASYLKWVLDSCRPADE